jgi:hypothetical protein
VPIFYEERQDKTDQTEVKEVNNDRKQTGRKNFPLIYCQRVLLLKKV